MSIRTAECSPQDWTITEEFKVTRENLNSITMQQHIRRDPDPKSRECRFMTHMALNQIKKREQQR